MYHNKKYYIKKGFSKILRYEWVKIVLLVYRTGHDIVVVDVEFLELPKSLPSIY